MKYSLVVYLILCSSKLQNDKVTRTLYKYLMHNFIKRDSKLKTTMYFAVFCLSLLYFLNYISCKDINVARRARYESVINLLEE